MLEFSHTSSNYTSNSLGRCITAKSIHLWQLGFRMLSRKLCHLLACKVRVPLQECILILSWEQDFFDLWVSWKSISCVRAHSSSRLTLRWWFLTCTSLVKCWQECRTLVGHLIAVPIWRSFLSWDSSWRCHLRKTSESLFLQYWGILWIGLVQILYKLLGCDSSDYASFRRFILYFFVFQLVLLTNSSISISFLGSILRCELLLHDIIHVIWRYLLSTECMVLWVI